MKIDTEAVDLWNKNFSHIYVEEGAMEHPVSRRILEKFPDSRVVNINHYKDVFCRPKQNNVLQKMSPNLILAVKQDGFVYEGSRMCDSFGNHNFYYTSSVMNCPYDCKYCYLQGMYPSSNIVIFVNLEDAIANVSRLLSSKGDVYLCVSYDTDLLALEGLTGFLRKWIDFALNNKNILIEIRTKSANFRAISDYFEEVPQNIILAWTLSPQEVISNYEKNTPSLEARLSSMSDAVRCGWKVRACFDPIVYVRDWEKLYAHCIDKTFARIDGSMLTDVSAGVFRVSSEYLKEMTKMRPDCAVLAYPFVKVNGVCTYDMMHIEKMMSFVREHLRKYVSDDKIFIYDEF